MSRSEPSALGLPRRLGPHDGPALAAVAALDGGLFPAAPLAAGNLVLLARAGLLLACLAGPTTCAGYALALPTLAPRRALLLALGTAPAWRGRGVASRLLESIYIELAVQGRRELELTVAPANAAALALYQRQGFVTVADLPDHLGPGQHRRLLVRSW